jgi:hypothetical protein
MSSVLHFVLNFLPLIKPFDWFDFTDIQHLRVILRPLLLPKLKRQIAMYETVGGENNP